MRKYHVEMIEWLDVTAYFRKDPFNDLPNIVRHISVGIVIREFVEDGVTFLRFCSDLGKLPYHEESDFVDIPLTLIIKRKALDNVGIDVGIDYDLKGNIK